GRDHGIGDDGERRANRVERDRARIDEVMTGDCHRSPAWTGHGSESVDHGSGARAELLDTADYRVRDVNFACDIGRHTQGKAELPFAEAMRAPLGEVGARAG